MIWKSFGACLLSAIALAAAQSPPGPPSQVPPVFRGGTTIVPLDVRVLDRNGKPVTDLTQSDFTLYEDNVKQEIRNFFAAPMTPRPVAPGDEDVPAGVGAAPSGPLAPRTRRTFLIVIGFDQQQFGGCLHVAQPRMRGPGRPVEGALSFVRDRLLPQDVAAVLAFNNVTEFTTNHARLIDVLERYEREYQPIAFNAAQWICTHPRQPLPPEIHAEMNRVFTGETAAEALADLTAGVARAGTHARSATELLLHIDPSLARTTDWQHPQPTMDDVQDFAGRVMHLTLDDAVALTDLVKVYAGLEYLRHLDGDKHLVFVGKGISFTHKEDDERLAARANDAGVALDIVHTDGLADHASLGDLFKVSSAENMAEWTGGSYTGVVTADTALAHLDEATRFGYLLGYTPTRPAADGSRREVRVKVNRPGLTVEFHHNYAAVGTISASDLKALIVASRLQAGGGFESKAQDIRLKATAVPMLRFGGSRQIRVDLTIDASRLSFVSTPEGHTAQLEVEIFCGDAKQAVVGDLKQTLEITADEDTYARFLRDGIPFSARVPAAGEVKAVKVVVYDPRDDLMGTVVATIK